MDQASQSMNKAMTEYHPNHWMRVTKVIVRVHINKIQEQEGRYSSISQAIAHNRHAYGLRISSEVARTCPLRHATRLRRGGG